MVTTAAVSQRIESGLTLVCGDVLALPDFAQKWCHLAEGVRASLSLEWDHSMADYLTELDEFYRAGRMTPEQADRYRVLLGQLKESLPIIRQLNFYPPPVSLDP
jgi:hypothetical protein